MQSILKHLPQVIESSGSGERKMDIVSRLMRERIIFLGDEIDTHIANVITAQLLLLDSEDNQKDITIYINSPGGSVIDGLAIYDTMQHITAPINTVCIGMAASMGSIILLGGSPGKRFALKNSTIMIHQGSGGTKGQATDIEIYTRELLRLEHLINEIMMFHTGQPLEKLVKDQMRDNYMTAQQACEYNLVDKVL
jgi:ATP-dependent Clp protease, protease subunit